MPNEWPPHQKLKNHFPQGFPQTTSGLVAWAITESSRIYDLHCVQEIVECSIRLQAGDPRLDAIDDQAAVALLGRYSEQTSDILLCDLRRVNGEIRRLGLHRPVNVTSLLLPGPEQHEEP